MDVFFLIFHWILCRSSEFLERNLCFPSSSPPLYSNVSALCNGFASALLSGRYRGQQNSWKKEAHPSKVYEESQVKVIRISEKHGNSRN